ncbi:MAG: biopolymer transporter ExbD [Symplocastrum torsivum CPER-KK1]|jgi:biopolymer transport protein ExbD|uniref:Biopolymer transporter ExbD n=1 Tax=Symplocastrum torsivum CPER-KK1 TaxID=450513 RepID=A0A951PPB0_9CYAN|nr:biopolymer transporter ExbD [Symplocastrum torsivum CPER-KK1]
MNKKIDSNPTALAPRPLRLRMDAPVEEVRVEIIPLIDVVFCILIFFILAAVSFSRQQAISVDLPKASTGTPQGREILVVSLNDLGQVYVEQQPVVTKDDFYQKLRAYRKENPNGLMALYASTNATYNDVVQVLDLLREVGGDRVALATLPGESEPTPGATAVPPPATGVPGFSPTPGTNQFDPYGTGIPGIPSNPTQPSLPGIPGQALPQAPGINPGSSQLSPGQPGISPGSSVMPTPGATVAPGNSRVAPGSSAVPTPGATVAPGSSPVSPGSSTAPTPGTTATPRTNQPASER